MLIDDMVSTEEAIGRNEKIIKMYMDAEVRKQN